MESRRLPPPLTPERLTRPHASIPRNPLVAGPLFLAGYIEQAGTGTLDIIARCRDAGLKPPEFRQDGGSFVQTLWRPAADGTTQVTPQATPQDNQAEVSRLSELAVALGLPTPQATPQVATQVESLLAAAMEGSAREALQTAADIRDREHFRKAYLEPLLNAGWLERTIPEKPTSPHQRYRLTSKGRAWLEQASRT